MFDEDLLAALDADPVVRERGRSAVLRDAAAEYLERCRRERLARQYAEAYGSKQKVDDELEGWEEQGEWPES